MDAEEKQQVEAIQARVTAWQKHLAVMPKDLSQYRNMDDWRRDYHEWCDEAEELVEISPNDAAFLLALVKRLAGDSAEGGGG